MTQILAVPRRKVLRSDVAGPEEGPRSKRPEGVAPCLFYLFVEFARPMAWVHALTVLHLGMVAAIWGLFVVVGKPKRPLPRPVWYMLGFIPLMAWHIPWALNNRKALWGLQDFSTVLFGAVIPLAVLPANLAAVRYLLVAYVFLHLPMAIHGLVYGGRGLTGWMGDENDLALALNIAIAIGIYLVVESRNKLRRILLMASMGVMLAANVSTISRGGFIGMAVVGIYLLLRGPHRLTIAFCVLLAVVGLALFAPATYWGEVQSIQTAAEPGDTGEQRFYLWGMAWRMFLDHPVTGVGTNNYGVQASAYEDTHRAETTGFHTWGRVAHSLYFTLLAEQGFVGVVLFLMILGWCFAAQRRLNRRAHANPEDPDARSASILAAGIVGGLVALLATGAFLSVIYYPLLWVLVALMGSLDGVMTAAPRTVRA